MEQTPLFLDQFSSQIKVEAGLDPTWVSSFCSHTIPVEASRKGRLRTDVNLQGVI